MSSPATDAARAFEQWAEAFFAERQGRQLAREDYEEALAETLGFLDRLDSGGHAICEENAADANLLLGELTRGAGLDPESISDPAN